MIEVCIFFRDDAYRTIGWDGRWVHSPLVFLLMGKSHQVVSPTGFLGAYSPGKAILDN